MIQFDIDSKKLYNILDQIYKDTGLRLYGDIDVDTLIWSVAAKIRGKNYMWRFKPDVQIDYDTIINIIADTLEHDGA